MCLTNFIGFYCFKAHLSLLVTFIAICTKLISTFAETYNFMKPTIAIACDHAGFDYKEHLKQQLAIAGYTSVDFGTHSTNSVDYPDYVHPLAKAIETEQAAMGILICGSANGVAITANKHQGIRAAIAWQNNIAALARQHNNANVICLPARFISIDNAWEFVQTFLHTSFEGGRHARRVQKIACV